MTDESPTGTTSEDVLDVLVQQHGRIRELFTEVRGSAGQHRQKAFDELRALLAGHETAEEMVLRPVSREVDAPVADARNAEEDEANRVLADLERMGVDDPGFDNLFASFERSVLDHAEREEKEEFPQVRAVRSETERRAMGRLVRAVEKVGPTHPHPSTAGHPAAQWAVGPFASLVDRARDALREATSGR